MSKSKKKLAIFSLVACVFALVCSMSVFQGKKVFAEDSLPKVYARDFVVSSFNESTAQMFIKYIGKEANIGKSISDSNGSGGWPAFDIVKKDGTTGREWFGGWMEIVNSVSGFNISPSSDWVQFTIPVQQFYSVELMENLVFKRVGDAWVAGSYTNTDFSVSHTGIDGENNSYIYLTTKGNYNLIDSAWYTFTNQAQTFAAKTADGTTKELTSNYFQLDKTTIYIKFADKALEGCTELTLPDGAYQIANDGTYRFFENFTFYSAHSGCWSAVKGELAETHEVDATCTTDGTKAYYTCSVCGKNYSDLACENEIADLQAWKSDAGKISAFGHSYGEWEKVTDPTATEKGEIKRVCAADESHVETFELPALNETDYECFEVTPVGCETAGSANFVYTKDGSTFTFEGTLAATGHKIVAVKGKVSTCTEYGYKAYYKCSVCEKAFEDENGETVIENAETWKQGAGKLTELGEHVYGEWEKVTDPTATEKGEIKRVCAADESHVETFELPALNETDYSYSVVTASTCLTAGVANYVYTKDGTSLTYETALALANHTLVLAAGKVSTCTEYGYKAYYQCSVCEKAFEDENGETVIENAETWKQGAGKITELSAHAYGEWMSDEKEHWHACSVCGDKKDVAAHEDSDNNGKCDVCEAAVEISTESGCNSSLSSGFSAAIAAILAAGAFVVIKKGRKEE